MIRDDGVQKALRCPAGIRALVEQDELKARDCKLTFVCLAALFDVEESQENQEGDLLDNSNWISDAALPELLP